MVLDQLVLREKGSPASGRHICVTRLVLLSFNAIAGIFGNGSCPVFVPIQSAPLSQGFSFHLFFSRKITKPHNRVRRHIDPVYSSPVSYQVTRFTGNVVPAGPTMDNIFLIKTTYKLASQHFA